MFLEVKGDDVINKAGAIGIHQDFPGNTRTNVSLPRANMLCLHLPLALDITTSHCDQFSYDCVLAPQQDCLPAKQLHYALNFLTFPEPNILPCILVDNQILFIN